MGLDIHDQYIRISRADREGINWLTGITCEHQIVQHSMTEQMYAASRQHSRIAHSTVSPASRDWIEAVWLLMFTINIKSVFVDRG